MDGIVELFREISRGLAAEFKIVRQIPHRGESGRGTEDALRALLRRHLPSRFEVTGGFAVGRGGAVSGQSDILIIDALNCPRFLQTPGTGLYPIDAVVGRIEVTQTLTTDKRKEDLDKIRKFRALPAVFEYAKDFRDSAPLGLLFAEASEFSIKAQAEWLAEEWRKTPEDQKGCLPNSIFILDRGMVFYQDLSGGLHCDPYDAKKVIHLNSSDAALLVWLIFTLHKFRLLLEHRIRARAEQILRIRTKDDVEKGTGPLLDAMGGEAYFPDWLEYFTIIDWESLGKVVGKIESVPL